MAAQLGVCIILQVIFYLDKIRCIMINMLFGLDKNYFVLLTLDSLSNTQLHSQDSADYLDHSSYAFLNESTKTNIKILKKYAN